MMRKILLLFTSIMMVLGMSACGGGSGDDVQSDNTPEAAVTGLLDAIKVLDQTKINGYVVEDDSMYTTEVGEDTETLMFENITYNVKSVDSKEDGSATVTVDISNIDMTAALKTYMENVMTSADADMTEEQAMTMLREAVEQNKDNVITKTVDLEVTQVEGQWKVKTTDDFMNIISGGMTDQMSFE